MTNGHRFPEFLLLVLSLLFLGESAIRSHWYWSTGTCISFTFLLFFYYKNMPVVYMYICVSTVNKLFEPFTSYYQKFLQLKTFEILCGQMRNRSNLSIVYTFPRAYPFCCICCRQILKIMIHCFFCQNMFIVIY